MLLIWKRIYGIVNTMLERILHNAEVFQMVGNSYKMKGSVKLFKDEQ